MNQHICPQSLATSLLDFSDFSYSISPDREIVLDEPFKKSIARYGILHPPIIKETEPESYVIVTGRKRLLAFRALFPKEKSCICMIISPRTTEIETFSIQLEEILTDRKPTPIEKALFLQKIAPLADEKHIAEEYLPRLDLPPDPSYIRQSISMLTFEEPLIRAIHQGDINEKVAGEIASLSAKDRQAVSAVLSSLQFSVSNQKKLLNISRELASRENRSITAVLEDKDVWDIINHPEANPPQKTKNLMNWLSRKYMPRSSQAEDEFKRLVAALQLPASVSVKHTPFFEDDLITLAITFSNIKSFQNAWKTIKETIRNRNN